MLALITVGPWLLLLVYDIILYMWRSVTFEMPCYGGRARGQGRPRAPSLKERPDGHRRRFSLAGVAEVPPPVSPITTICDGTPKTPTQATSSGHKRQITATMSRPIFEFVDDDE